ncbi:MAG TPA: hypothetical protein VKK06_10735, partial [Terriglobia bacterium]|nr:hypothetical protein [Terriglobia bacterium]
AHRSRTRGRRASSAIDSRGPEGWAVAIILVSIEKHDHQKQVDETAAVDLKEIVGGNKRDQIPAALL